MLVAHMYRPTSARVRFASRFIRLAATLVCVVTLLACQKPLERYDWSDYDGPGAKYVHREEYVLPFFEDPLEPVNRLTNGLNTGAHILAIDPLATGWRYAVPQEARTAMDFIDGLSLDDYLIAHTLSTRAKLELFVEICNAVNVAHLRGVIHRDLKPSNIRIDRAGRPHILDFGLAKTDEHDEFATVHTMTGQFVGSLPW